MNATGAPWAKRVGALLLPTLLLGALTARAEPVVHWTFDVTGDEVSDAAGDCHGTLEGDRAPDL